MQSVIWNWEILPSSTRIAWLGDYRLTYSPDMEVGLLWHRPGGFYRLERGLPAPYRVERGLTNAIADMDAHVREIEARVALAQCEPEPTFRDGRLAKKARN